MEAGKQGSQKVVGNLRLIQILNVLTISAFALTLGEVIAIDGKTLRGSKSWD
jgi:hypothetical protein